MLDVGYVCALTGSSALEHSNSMCVMTYHSSGLSRYQDLDIPTRELLHDVPPRTAGAERVEIVNGVLQQWCKLFPKMPPDALRHVAGVDEDESLGNIAGEAGLLQTEKPVERVEIISAVHLDDTLHDIRAVIAQVEIECLGGIDEQGILDLREVLPCHGGGHAHNGGIAR